MQDLEIEQFLKWQQRVCIDCRWPYKWVERKHQTKSEPHISIVAKCWNYKAILNFVFQNITHSGHEFSEKHCTRKKKKKKKDMVFSNSFNTESTLEIAAWHLTIKNKCFIKEYNQNLKWTFIFLQKTDTIAFIKMLTQENLNIVYGMCENEFYCSNTKHLLPQFMSNLLIIPSTCCLPSLFLL